MMYGQLNEMSSGQGEIPDRRYSPRAAGPLAPTQTRCNSGTDSDARLREVWMEEDVLKLRTLLLILTPGRHGLSGVHIRKELFFMSARSARIKKLAVMAMLVALSIVLVSLVHFPIFAPVAFLEYDPADIPILIGTFAYGPLAGVALTVAVSVIQGLTVSAQSGVMGIAMHIFATTTLVLVAGIIYRVRHTRRGAVLALICGTLAMTGAMLVFNHFLTPYFLAGGIGDGAAVAANRELVDTLLFPFILPFNLIKAGANSAVTFLVYKTVSRYIVHGDPFAVPHTKASEA